MKSQLQFKSNKIKYNTNYHQNKFNKLLTNRQYFMLRGIYAKNNYFDIDFDEDNKILEFGCGVGNNLSHIKNRYGYDINKSLYPALKKQGIIMYNKQNDIPDNYFDDILICMVLEHLPNPIATLNFLKGKLKDNGRIRIVLPNPNMKVSKIYGLNKSVDGHLFAWTFYEINYLLNYCGFTNILNRKIYRRGIERFYPISKISASLYFFITTIVGKILNDFDILVVSKKSIKTRRKTNGIIKKTL